MTLKICQVLSSWPQLHPNQSMKADGNRLSLPLLSPHLPRLLALFFPSTFFSVISNRLGTVESYSEAGGQKRWRPDEDEGRAVLGPLSSWDPKLYNQFFFRVHADLRKYRHTQLSWRPG